MTELKFKPKSAWRYIGKGSPATTSADVVTGKAVYGMDARMDGMVYASIERPPVLGGKVKSFDDKEALKVAGVSQTVSIDPFKGPWGFQPLGGVAVIAEKYLGRISGPQEFEDRLGQWTERHLQLGPSTRSNCKRRREARRKSSRNRGDVDAAFAKGGKIIEAEYYVPHLAHAAMEPLVAVADFRDGKVTAWAPTQNPQAVQETVAQGRWASPRKT